jgi:hypothetical protein
MPIRVANWNRQQKLLDPKAALSGPSASLGQHAYIIDGIVSALAFLNNYSLQWRVQNEFKGIVPSVESTITSWADSNPSGQCYDPADVGALIHLITWTGSAPLGMKAPAGFVAIFLGDCGMDFQSVFLKYCTPDLIGGVPSGPSDSSDKWSFFWYTLP